MPFILPVLTWTSKPLGSRGSVGACGSLCHRPALICLGSTKVSTADEDSTDNALTGSAMLERLRCCHRDLFAGHRANPPSPSTFQAVPVLPAPSDQPWGAPARFGRRSVLNSGKSSVQFLSHFQTLRATGSSPVEALPGSGCGDAALFPWYPSAQSKGVYPAVGSGGKQKPPRETTTCLPQELNV